MRWRFLALALAISVASPLPSSLFLHAQPSDTFLQAAHWLDPVSGRLGGPVIVQVSNGKIARVGAPGEFDQLPGSAMTNLGAATLLPGLIDAHVHLQLGGALPQANAGAILRAGFTTVVDLGATTDIVLRLRQRISSGAIVGPRILAAGRWVGKQGGICEFGGIGIPGGPDAYRARVREDVAAGADLTKVCVSTWLADAFARPESYEISDEALAAAVDEAHRAGRLVVAHAISIGSVKAALRAGVDGLAHAAYVDVPTARELRNRGVFMVVTLASLAGVSAEPPVQALRRSVATAHAEGVPIVFGTDGGVLPHGENAKEFAALVEAGLPALEAIRAATVNAARAFRLDREVGQIKAGYRADIIAVNGDPLHDIQSLSNPIFVMYDGTVVQ